jgi:ATP-dependent Clp protease adapter protein ClpS
MSDVQAKVSHLEVIFHNDDETPVDFVIELLHSVFKKQIADAVRFTEAIKHHGQASCGTYPHDVAAKLLKTAQKAIRITGVPLRITSEAVTEDDDTRNTRCKLCGTLFKKNRVSLKGMRTLVCDDCMYEVTSNLPEVTRKKKFDYACDALAWHFAAIPRDQLVSTSRLFPGHMRADVQAGIDRLFSAPIRFFGIHEEHRYETLSLAGTKQRRPECSRDRAGTVSRCGRRRERAGKMSQQRPLALPNRRPALRGRALLAPGVRLRVRDQDRDCRACRR